MTGDVPPYMPQLDGVRALAVSLVMISHFALLDSISALQMPGRFLGAVGVDLFFVLSGFLITGILLAASDRTKDGERSAGTELRHFYARRFLRIFPIYYLTIAALALAGLPSVTHYLGWHLTYLANWYVAANPIDLFPANHFWSLAVEEQFYLVWPSLILFLPRRRLVPVVLLLCAVAIATRFGLCLAGVHPFTIRFNTVTCLDYLALGALLAILRREGEQGALWLRRIASIGLWVGTPGVVYFLATARGLDDMRYWAFAPPFVALWSAWLIERSARGAADTLGRALATPPAVALGRVSYGVYVYHAPVLWWMNGALTQWGWNLPGTPRFLVMLAATLAVATASWWVIERPINGLKRHFPY